MKTPKKVTGVIVVALLFVIGSFQAMALEGTPNDRIGVKINPGKNYQTVKVQLYNLLAQPTKILVRSNTGEVLYREKVKNAHGYAKNLNFSRLPKGDYSISIEQENIRVTRFLTTVDFGLVMGGTETWKFESPEVDAIADQNE